MVLGFLKRLLGRSEPDPAERRVLERAWRETVRELRAKEQLAKKVPAGRSKKTLSAQARAILQEIDRLKARKKELERQLGGPPEETGFSKSKRTTR